MGPDKSMDDIRKFESYLMKSGATIVPPTNEWEVLRFKTSAGVSVVYTNKRGDLTMTGEAQKAYSAFKAGRGFKTVDRKRQSLRQLKARIAARDGKECFFHGAKLPFDQLTIEHMLSFSHGGSDNINNLVLACRPCNEAVANLSVAQKIRVRETLRGRVEVKHV